MTTRDVTDLLGLAFFAAVFACAHLASLVTRCRNAQCAACWRGAWRCGQ